MSDDTVPPTDHMQVLSDEFDALMQTRHMTGQEEYGAVAFLKAPLLQMAAEELADLCNYARYMYIRLRLMEEALNASGIDLSTSTAEEIRLANEVPSSAPAFIPGAEVQRFLSESEQ